MCLWIPSASGSCSCELGGEPLLTCIMDFLEVHEVILVGVTSRNPGNISKPDESCTANIVVFGGIYFVLLTSKSSYWDLLITAEPKLPTKPNTNFHPSQKKTGNHL